MMAIATRQNVAVAMIGVAVRNPNRSRDGAAIAIAGSGILSIAISI
jgi:hypothetical protein